MVQKKAENQNGKGPKFYNFGYVDALFEFCLVKRLDDQKRRPKIPDCELYLALDNDSACHYRCLCASEVFYHLDSISPRRAEMYLGAEPF